MKFFYTFYKICMISWFLGMHPIENECRFIPLFPDICNRILDEF